MCGIAGFLRHKRIRSRYELEAVAARMAQALAHRGPDDAGVWTDVDAKVALAHRRLSIIDLSPEGRQPMISSSGRFVVVFNGEIYNFRELREELQPCLLRGSSDTEIMLAAFERWGLEDAVRRFNGMFAFAVWDRDQRSLSLVRDRMGEKPLYYARTQDGFLFGSELKALRAHPAFPGAINRGAVALFLRYGYVPTPYSIYADVKKLPPGTLLAVDEDANEIARLRYWSAREIAERGCGDPLRLSEHEAADELEALLSDSVKRRMVSDVPLGAFLSGGIDSSLVVALMQRHSAAPVKTFTIGFRESAYNEADSAERVAGHLGCEHTTLYVTPADAMNVVPQLPELYDEPFADSSQIPSFLVSRLARNRVTVSLSGDGGDEVFGGYTRYLWTRQIWRTFGWMPPSFRAWCAEILMRTPRQAWERVLRQRNPADKIQKLASLLQVKDQASIYLSLVSHWKDADSVVLDAPELPTVLTQPDGWPDLPDFLHTMMFLDTVTYLADDILVKLDRASMGVGLEARVPLLDPRVVEFAWQLPLGLKVRGRQSKWLLRRVLHKYVPPALTERPKAGFGVPIAEWLGGPLRAWAEELLDARRLRQEGFFDPAPIRQKWTEHLSGRRNWAYALWNVLMFQAWLEIERKWSDSESAVGTAAAHC